MKKDVAFISFLDYSLGMDKYKGFEFGMEFGFITFHNPDMEDGSGEWSGTARTLKDAYALIDELVD